MPKYNDSEESDVFILSGVEDLVPLYRRDSQGNLESDAQGRLIIDEDERDGYKIHFYRPRIEGLFARIERWTKISGSNKPHDIHWRSISNDNVLTIYGKDDNSRIVDPNKPGHIFSWLICETRDDKGNALIYEYKEEDGAGVELDQACERNRGDINDHRRTANRYIKHIRYGNRTPMLDNAGHRPRFLSQSQLNNAGWMFEVVFDYGEHDAGAPNPNDAGEWTYRDDSFSSYRSGFEVRTTRLCQHVLMFHHFDGEECIGEDCLVRTTDFTYSHEKEPKNARNPIYTFLHAVTQNGYKRKEGDYLKRSLPPVEFEYTQPVVQDMVEEVDPDSLENLPIGVDGTTYQWTDLHGEGIPGILTEQAGAWFYKRNLSPSSDREVEFAPLELVKSKPNPEMADGAQFMDLAGDGQLDLVMLDRPTPGLYEHDGKEGWKPFLPFTSRLNRDMRDPNLKFIDLDGDGHADVLITEDNAFIWHASLAETGFGPARRVHQVLDEEKGPRLVFADGTQSIYLADLSGDGLTDLVRVRNGEICYWPNLGYCEFGTKITMDHSPLFDCPDQIEHKRILMADIDGTGTTDIIYLHRDGVRLYFNQSGNSWSQVQVLKVFPRINNLVNVAVTDLLGNGTACLVWSSPLPGHGQRPMRYINLMGKHKPHLLVTTRNNLGAETRVRYASSIKFYLQDKQDGNPWITRLPFPVHVMERVETYDWISRNRFVSRYAYHHGYFDGEEREFRGFGMVEQWDTEEIGKLTQNKIDSKDNNLSKASFVPPVLTKSWFHTGAYKSQNSISSFFAGIGENTGEYYREPGLKDPEVKALLLPDTVLPAGITAEEEHEACRALKGSLLRQEVYALDGTDKEEHPYTVTEQNFTIEQVQRRGNNRHSVFFTHPREVINYHYERNPEDPRISHELTLEVDGFGNILKEVSIGYGRRKKIRIVDNITGTIQTIPNPALQELKDWDQSKQTTTFITYTENRFTRDNDTGDNAIDQKDDYRAPLPAVICTYELTGYLPVGQAKRFQAADFVKPDPNHIGRLVHIFDSNVEYEKPPNTGKQRRLIECVRTYYRSNDLASLSPVGKLESLALPGESYTLAYTPGLLAGVFKRAGQPLIPNIDLVLGSQGSDGGGYVDLDGDDHWWIPSGRIYFSQNPNDTAVKELAQAWSHFFLPQRFKDAFDQNTTATYDNYNLFLFETEDPLGNRVTAGIRKKADGTLEKSGIDYRVLQPYLMMDPNRNRTEVDFDLLGLVVGTAVMGKPEDNPVNGDLIDNSFNVDLSDGQISAFIDAVDPHGPASNLLAKATSRIIYDLDRFYLAQQKHPDNPEKWEPSFAATLVRETHVSDLQGGQTSKIQVSFSYSDGFGREVQKKIQAEPGPVPKRDTNGKITVGANGQPVMTQNDPGLRWVGSGWTLFNNKGKPVRQYEPYFTDSHSFEFEPKIGVSPLLFYDPLEREVATLHPNHAWEKVIFDSWRQESWDVNDVVLISDPKTDPDVGDFFDRMPDADYLPAWHTLRTDSAQVTAFTARYPDSKDRTNEASAAKKAAAHAGTPAVAYFDALGRTFLTVAHNKVVCPGHDRDGTEEKLCTRVELDIEGNQRAVRDAVKQAFNAQGNEVEDPLGRIVMRYDYDIAGPEENEDEEDEGGQNAIHQASMEAGERWALSDVVGNPIRAWDSRGFTRRMTYDELRRPIGLYVNEKGAERLVEKSVYGENQGDANNHCGQLYQQLDQASVLTSARYDFKGNLLKSRRQLQPQYKQAIDWKTTQSSGEVFSSSTAFDALNRAVQLIAPHSNKPGTKVNVIQPGYNDANLLERMEVWLNRNIEPVDLLGSATANLHAVTNIDYDAKGQRNLIDYGTSDGKVVRTRYAYDYETFRLTHLYTRRGIDPTTGHGLSFTDDCDNPNPPPSTIAAPDTAPQGKSCGLQNLHYTYDPVGNITHIRDEAQQTIFFSNKRVDPSAEYTYDALYRLIQATGREHLGQNSKPIPHTHDDALRSNRPHPGDGRAMGTYTERYLYDEVGNFLKMLHRGDDPVNSGWTRTYAYEQTSLIEDGTGGLVHKRSNRLSSTRIGNGINSPLEKYTYDTHGNMLRMPHLGGGAAGANMHWDFEDQLQRVDLGGGGTAYYVYDTGGERVRKVIERQNGTLKEERIYLGGFDIYRKYHNNGSTVNLERETLHVMDGQQRIALMEIKTVDTNNDSSPSQLIRYQYGNHLGSASLELNEKAQLISYEEYSPYGSTVYQSVDKNIKAAAKRYRYTGKERDEESGLNYHGARYYSAWLGRWLNCDPTGLLDGLNLYENVGNSPTSFLDPSGARREYHGVGGWIHQNVYEPAQRGYTKWIQWGMTAGNRWGAKVPVAGHIGGSVVGIVPRVLGGAGQAFTGLLQFVTPRTQEDHFLTVVSAGSATPVVRAGTALRSGWRGLRKLLSRNRRAVPQAISKAEGRAPQLATKAAEDVRTSPTTPLSKSANEAKAELYYVKGQTTRPATQEEADFLRMSIDFEREVSVSTVSGKQIAIVGKRKEVSVSGGPNVTDVLHTHPVSRMARPSAGDINYIKSNNYPSTATHRIVGEKWPATRRIAEKLDVDPPPFEPVTTTVPQSGVTSGSVSSQYYVY